jgi:hypothetical protein
MAMFQSNANAFIALFSVMYPFADTFTHESGYWQDIQTARE